MINPALSMGSMESCLNQIPRRLPSTYIAIRMGSIYIIFQGCLLRVQTFHHVYIKCPLVAFGNYKEIFHPFAPAMIAPGDINDTM
jgi:hypothetical protein